MRNILHILTKPDDQLASAVIENQRQMNDCVIVVFDSTAPEPDYNALLEAIFNADSVQVW